jgi:hypothetical protein
MRKASTNPLSAVRQPDALRGLDRLQEIAARVLSNWKRPTKLERKPPLARTA